MGFQYDQESHCKARTDGVKKSTNRFKNTKSGKNVNKIWKIKPGKVKKKTQKCT